MRTNKEVEIYRRLWGNAWVDRRQRAKPSLIRSYHKLLIDSNSKCSCCGQKGTEVGHIIPQVCFSESGLNEDLSYFDENLIPVCGKCNKVWIHNDCLQFLHYYWGEKKSSYWINRLYNTVRIARNRGILIYLTPLWSHEGWPGPVIIAPPPNKTHFRLQVVGYLKPLRLFPRMPRFRATSGVGRFRLSDLYSEEPEIIEKYFVLSKRALDLINLRKIREELR